MRILYSSNAVWCNTGYGVQEYLIPRLSALECVGGAEKCGAVFLVWAFGRDDAFGAAPGAARFEIPYGGRIWWASM